MTTLFSRSGTAMLSPSQMLKLADPRSSLISLVPCKVRERAALLLSIFTAGLLANLFFAMLVFAALHAGPLMRPATLPPILASTNSGTSMNSTTAGTPMHTAQIMPRASSPSQPLDGLGDQPFYTYTSLPLTDELKLKVNVADGNLLLESTDYTTHGTGIDLNISSYYNSLNNYNYYTYEHGNLWTFSLCSTQYVDLRTPTTGITYFGPTNTGAYFAYKSAGANSTKLYTDAPGIKASLVGNADGTYTLTYHQSGEKIVFGADTSVEKVQDKNNNTISCTYSYTGTTKHTASLTDTQGRVITPTLDSANHITALSDQFGNSVHYGYDANNHLTSITDRNGKQTTYGYTGDLLTSITDALTHKTTIQYVSGTSQVSQITAADTGTIQYAYHASTDSACSNIEPNGQTALPCTVVTDQNGHSTTYLYNGQWQVPYTKDARGIVSSQTFDATTYNITQQQDALSNLNTFTFSQDGFNNLTTAADGSGSVITFGYNTSGGTPYYPMNEKTARTGSTSTQNDFSYDGNGNLTSAVDDSTKKGLTYAYNSNGTVASQTDADGNKTTYSYDSKGNLTTITPPGPVGQTTLTYDSLSRVATETDGLHQTTSYTYDSVGRVLKIISSDSSGDVYTYDAVGNMLTQTDPTTVQTTFQYDARNRLTIKTVSDGAITITNGYDKVGNLTTYNDGTGQVTYTYDAANRMTVLTEPDGSKTTYGYDNDNHKTSIAYPNGTGQVMAYDGAGHETSVKGGVMNAQGAITTTYDSFTYSYMAGSTSTALLQSVTFLDPVGHSTTYKRTYTYDSQNRLLGAAVTNVATSSQVNNFTYAYDANGNRTSSSVAASGTSTTYQYNAANELTTSTTGSTTTTYSYDANGNLTGQTNGNSFTYNNKDQTGSINSSSYMYSGPDQRDRIQINNDVFGYGTLGLTLWQVSGQGNTDFVRCSCGMLNDERTSGGQKYYYLFDGEGSIVGMTDKNSNEVASYDYDPYGVLLNSYVQSGLSNPWTYAGGYYESSTGLYKFGIRYYDPKVGRWTQRTPVGGSLQETTKANPYEYADDNPVNEIDPSGKGDIVLCAVGVAAAVTGIVAGIAGIVAVVALTPADAAGVALVGADAGLVVAATAYIGGVAAAIGTWYSNVCSF